jgi:phosphate transport system substrate-binding protein
VELEKPPVDPAAPKDYRDATENTVGRLSLTFRFRPNRSTLDAKSVRDLDRVLRFVARPENRGREIVLLGFSDSVGSAAANEKLSADRAREVGSQLGMRGLRIRETLGLGPAMPVASNETEVGKNKNRRVEIWLR